MACHRFFLCSLLVISLIINSYTSPDASTCASAQIDVNSSRAVSTSLPELGRPMRDEFLIDPNFIQLNHGSYGTFPKQVFHAFQNAQLHSEQNIEKWIRRELLVEMTRVRSLLAKYLNVIDPDDLVLIPNTTGGMNAIFRSLKFKKSDQILQFNTSHKGVQALIRYVLDNENGNVTRLVFDVQYPISNEQMIRNFQTFLDTHHSLEGPIRIAVVDHITSEPGIVNPIADLIPLLKQRGIMIVIDGAHAIGHVPVDLQALDVDFYITNCHKWLFSVRGSAVMYVKKEHQKWMHPAQISFNYNPKSNFQNEFFWTGSSDFSSFLTISAALEFRAAIGEEKLRNYNHRLAVDGGNLVAEILGTRVLQVEETQIGNMVDIEVPLNNPDDTEANTPSYWINTLLDRFGLFVTTYKHNGRIWIRLSAQIYNDLSDFKNAAEAVKIMANELNEKSVTCE